MCTAKVRIRNTCDRKFDCKLDYTARGIVVGVAAAAAAATKCARLFTTRELFRVLFARLHRAQTCARDKAACSLLLLGAASTYRKPSDANERASIKAVGYFRLAHPDKPLEYVDLQIKKFTSVSRELAPFPIPGAY